MYNSDVRSVKLDRLVDAVLTSPPYPGVYDYLSFARKVRAGSGTATAVNRGGDGSSGGSSGGSGGKEGSDGENGGTGVSSDGDRLLGMSQPIGGGGTGRIDRAEAVVPGSDAYFNTAVPADRSWPSAWTEGEIGTRRALRSDPYAFKEVWQREQEGWLGMVAASLKPGWGYDTFSTMSLEPGAPNPEP